jgi:NAD(P)-dependent dehydrogenase (short-subunit alcohol dehydrogenase family)
VENNKWIIVLGSNGLIGNAVVNELLETGHFVLGVDLEKNEINDKKFISLVFDVSKTFAINDFLISIFKDYNPIGMVNCSFPRGKGWKRDPHDITSEEMNDCVNVHLNSYNLFTYYFANICSKKNIESSIVNIASIFGVIAPPVHLYNWEDSYPSIPYPAIKGGIIAFTRYSAAKYGKNNIRINCISPGVVMGSKMQDKSNFIDGMKMNMLGRIARPIEIAKPIKFLISQESSFITGQNIVVDGGWTNI